MENIPDPEKNPGKGIFGFTFTPDEALINIIPVPWDLTASYGKGAAGGPRAIFNASFQVDIYKDIYPEYWKKGIAIKDIPEYIETLNYSLYPVVNKIMNIYNENIGYDENIQKDVIKINDASAEMNEYVFNSAIEICKQKKIPLLLGGDHSCALGLIMALDEMKHDFGVLHIDAHADLRKAYQGFHFSHASVMYNVYNLTNVKNIVQVGIRDYSYEEEKRIRNYSDRIITFTDKYLKHNTFGGITWQEQTADIINHLPARVYISFDIDGLEPVYCRGTGAPVPGGLTYEQVCYLLEGICNSGRKIIGADLCEVATDINNKSDWDANIGSRLLLELCAYMIYSNDK